jgi:hypothetical protein
LLIYCCGPIFCRHAPSGFSIIRETWQSDCAAFAGEDASNMLGKAGRPFEHLSNNYAALPQGPYNVIIQGVLLATEPRISLKSCQQQFLEKFVGRHPPSKSSIWPLSKKLETKRTLLDEHTGGPKMNAGFGREWDTLYIFLSVSSIPAVEAVRCLVGYIYLSLKVGTAYVDRGI